MKNVRSPFIFSFILLFCLASRLGAAETASWPTWRGNSQTGVIEGEKPPLQWSDDSNIKWKTRIPGAGLASPIIWGDRIFLLTAIAQEGESSRQVDTQTQRRVQPGAGDRPRGRAEAGGERPQRGVQARGGQAGARPGGGPGGREGLNREELLQRFDKDNDGQLNEEERAALRASFGGQRGGRGGQAAGRQRGGRGGATPTAAQQFTVMALDRGTGEVLWQQSARVEVPHEGHHPTNTYASASPVTDGEYLYAFFGSRGLYCYDFEGNLKWKRDLGNLQSRAGFGEGASPALAGDLLFINWDNEGQSYLIALDKGSGEEVWKVKRDERTSWVTPTVVEVEGKQQVIMPGTNATRSYDAATGELIWEAEGLTGNVIPTPVVGNDKVYVMSGYQGRSIQAIELSAKGDVSDSDAIVWSVRHSAPYVPSAVLSNGRLYVNKGNDAYYTCLDAETGDEIFRDESLEGIRGIYASPIAANGYIYVVGREGTTLVLKDADTFEIVATNKLGDRFDASPAIVDNELFLRGHDYLYCISQKAEG